MKQIVIFIFAGFILLSCHKENAKTNTVSYEVMQHPTWAAEPFKVENTTQSITTYTIQFPQGYSGGVGIAPEGNTFHKFIPGYPSYPVSIRYYFCSPLHCYPFQDTLANVAQPSVVTLFNGFGNQYLDHRIELTSNGQLIGVIYHNNNAALKGALYWKDDNVFKNAVIFQGELQRLPEIIEILRTVKKV